MIVEGEGTVLGVNFGRPIVTNGIFARRSSQITSRTCYGKRIKATCDVYLTVEATRYRAAKQYAPADRSSTGTYQWCGHLANTSEAAPATAWLHRSGRNCNADQWVRLPVFQHGVSYWRSMVTIGIIVKCTVVELEVHGTTDRRTDGQIGASLNAPVLQWGT